MAVTVCQLSVWLLCLLSVCQPHGRMMEPPSRASMWRVGFPTPKNEDDNALYCGGFGVQWDQNGGRCGICGDPWDVFPRPNEAPHGMFATGIIAKTYRQGSIIPVVVDLTANHQGQFTFKLCPNNDIWQDPDQICFDSFPLLTGKEGRPSHGIQDYQTGLRLVYVHLPHRVTCSQCILQWTYTAGNNWGVCSNGTGSLGCGPQETFRACSDIRILRTGKKKGLVSKIASFSDETTFDLDQFEDYYDDLFDHRDVDDLLLNSIDDSPYEEEEYYDYQPTAMMSIHKLRLIQKKLVLAQALKSLRHLISISQEDTEKKDSWQTSTSKFSPVTSTSFTPLPPSSRPLQFSTSTTSTSSFLDQLDRDRQEDSSSWWSGSNSHGRRRRRRRKRRFSLLYDLLS